MFNMCYATPAQPKSLPTKLFNTTLIQPDFINLSENDFRSLHLHNLESLRRYHFALHSHNLTFTTLVQFDFKVLHLHNLKSLSTIRLCTLHSHNLTFATFVYTTWFQGSTLAQWLFHSCCVCMFCYIYVFRTYIYV